MEKQIPRCTQKKNSFQSLLITESNKMHTELNTETQDGEWLGNEQTHSLHSVMVGRGFMTGTTQQYKKQIFIQ